MPEPITDGQWAAWQALTDAATEEPWTAEYSGEQGNCVLPPDARSTREAVAVTRLLRQQADAEFIAAARTAVPALLAALREMEAERDDALRSRDRWRESARKWFRRRAGTAEAERDAPRRRVEAVRALHTPATADFTSGWTGTPFTECTACSRSWPCPTIRALDGVS